MTGYLDEWFQNLIHSAPQKPGLRAVAMALLLHADDETGAADPTQSELAKVAGCSEKTVSRHLKELESLGWVERKRAGRAYRYALDVPDRLDFDDPDGEAPGRDGASRNGEYPTNCPPDKMSGIDETPDKLSGKGKEYPTDCPVTPDKLSGHGPTPDKMTGIEGEHPTNCPVGDAPSSPPPSPPLKEKSHTLKEKNPSSSPSTSPPAATSERGREGQAGAGGYDLEPPEGFSDWREAAYSASIGDQVVQRLARHYGLDVRSPGVFWGQVAQQAPEAGQKAITDYFDAKLAELAVDERDYGSRQLLRILRQDAAEALADDGRREDGQGNVQTDWADALSDLPRPADQIEDTGGSTW